MEKGRQAVGSWGTLPSIGALYTNFLNWNDRRENPEFRSAYIQKRLSDVKLKDNFSTSSPSSKHCSVHCINHEFLKANLKFFYCFLRPKLKDDSFLISDYFPTLLQRLLSLFQSNVTKRAGIYLIFSDFPLQRLQHSDIHLPALTLNLAMAAQDRFLFPKFWKYFHVGTFKKNI